MIREVERKNQDGNRGTVGGLGEDRELKNENREDQRGKEKETERGVRELQGLRRLRSERGVSRSIIHTSAGNK